MHLSASQCLRHSWMLLGISESHIAERQLPIFDEAAALEVAEVEPKGRRHYLTPQASSAWKSMKSAALSDGIEIYVASAHRSIQHQVEIIAQKLESGQTIEQILTVVAPPGCSEHHTGCAVDIGTEGSKPLEAEFEHTPAFRWLTQHASQHSFRLSFPRENVWGYTYEPWHWCFSQAAAQQVAAGDV